MRGRYAAFFMGMAETASPELFTEKQVWWLTRLENDYDNYRAAMAWALESDHREVSLRIAAALTWFWIYHRHVSDGQDWLERAVLQSEDVPPTLRAVVLARASILHAKKLTDFDRLNGRLDESLSLWQQAGSNEGMAEAQFNGSFGRLV